MMVDHPWRRALEWTLRAMALLALVGLIVYTVYTYRVQPSARAAGSAVGEALVRWSGSDPPARAHVHFDSAAAPEMRDWLAALAGAGTRTTWSGAAPAPSALAVEPVADPERPSRLWVASPDGASIVLGDAMGVLDSVGAVRGGAQLTVPQLEGVARAEVGTGARRAAATAVERDSLLLRPILLLGQARWEAKFTLAALEEHGWKVDARLAVAPSGDARQGAARVTIDTAHYAAVIALDSVAARYADQIARYVRSGGGLVAAGDGASLRALAPLLPAVATPPTLPGTFAADTARPRTALALAALRDIEPGAIALERRGTSIAAAAWRVGEGRVVQLGYHDIWRWRMAGVEPDPRRAHRAWWGAVVSSVAYSPRVPRAVIEEVEPTPLVSLLAALGPPSEMQRRLVDLIDDPRVPGVLFGVLLGALLLEWGSRRLRGVR